MTTLLLTHPSSFEHETPAGHPERPERIRAIEKALEGDAFWALKRDTAPAATIEMLERAHDPDYLQALEDLAPKAGLTPVDADTIMSPGTWKAALNAAGAAVMAVDAVASNDALNAFCALRPPGHHAEYDRAMGFCFLNNAVIAARHAQKAHGFQRVAILDWDVHHGNGTQHIVASDEALFYASTHEMPLFPGTGSADETGEHDNVFNIPLKAGDEGAVFLEALRNRILPRLETFHPDLIVISAGFDAHWRDPLGRLNFREDDFAAATRDIMEKADKLCAGRIVSVLEGGYDLEGLSASVAAHVAALMEH